MAHDFQIGTDMDAPTIRKAFFAFMREYTNAQKKWAACEKALTAKRKTKNPADCINEAYLAEFYMTDAFFTVLDMLRLYPTIDGKVAPTFKEWL